MHIAAQLALAVSLPREWLVIVPIQACLFTLGRFLFARGYLSSKTPMLRAYGFAMTFFPTVLALGYVNIKNFTGFEVLPATIPKLI